MTRFGRKAAVGALDGILRELPSAAGVTRVTCYVLRVTCYVLRVTCYVLRVTCHTFHSHLLAVLCEIPY